MTAALGPTAVLERVREHSRTGRAVLVLLALVVGAYAGWLGGDYGLGLGSVVGFALVTAYVLLQQPTTRAVVARGLSLLSVLVLATPVVLNLPLLTAPFPTLAPATRTVLHPGVLALAIVFVVLAGILAGIGAVVDDR